VITGASRGLGAGLATAFAARGLRLGLCARTRPHVPDGAEAIAAELDVRDPAAVEGFAREIAGRFGRIDLWVNNAGVLEPIGPLADADPEQVREHLEINVLGVAIGSAAFARHVRSREGRGVLVNISSGAATTVYVGWAPYCSSKAAVDMLTAVVGREERGSGLVAYALSPGVVDTDMQRMIRDTSAEVLPASDRFRRLHREGRFNSPDRVAAFILERCLTREASTVGALDDVAAVRLRVPDQPPDGGGTVPERRGGHPPG
jgi:NAD(P)-dependent dehydrogenase (short-subunit alcohol dehydrogenase family)